MSGLLWNIPPLPLYYLPRQEELARVKAALLEAMPGPVVITGVGRDDGGPGMEGLGKSVLAAATAHDPEVGQAFTGGPYPTGQPTVGAPRLSMCHRAERCNHSSG